MKKVSNRKSYIKNIRKGSKNMNIKLGHDYSVKVDTYNFTLQRKNGLFSEYENVLE